MKKFFITSTGTGVGKTYITASIARQLVADGKSVRVLKPILTGYIEGEENDLTVLSEAAGGLADIALYKFNDPVSPDIAAHREGREIDFAEVVKFCHAPSDADYLLVEGIGGVMVPLGNGKTILDLITELQLPVILVVGSYLGTISHTLTAFEALKARGVQDVHIIINESEESGSTLSELKESLSLSGLNISILNRGLEVILTDVIKV